MFKKGEVVFVGTKGVCLIEDVKKNAFVGCDKSKEYYILRPIENNSNMVVFLPTCTPIKIRNLISKDKAQEILNDLKKYSNEVSTDNNERYFINDEVLKDIDIESRIRALIFLYNKKNES